MEVLAEGHSCSDNTAEVEDCPEDTDEASLLALRGVAHHKRALCCPEQTSTDTENGTGGDDEAARIRVDVYSTTRRHV